MKNKPFKVSGVVTFLIIICCLNAFAQKNKPVRIEFDDDSKRIDMVTDRELPKYTHARRGSFQFFTERLDEPEDVIHYFHDGKRTVKIEDLQSMEKFQKSHAMWRLRFRKGRKDSPQYIPRIHTLAVSFVPLNLSTGEPARRVYLLLNDLKLIDWNKEDK